MRQYGIDGLREQLKNKKDTVVAIDRDLAQLLVDAVDEGLTVAFTNYLKSMKERNASQESGTLISYDERAKLFACLRINPNI